MRRAASFCAPTTRASVNPAKVFVSPAEPAIMFVPAASEFVGVKTTDRPGLRLSETAGPLVSSVAGGMTLDTNRSIAW